jgi:Tfp pilus assembly protein PilX
MKSRLNDSRPKSLQCQDGMALVLTLALIVLVTVAAVAFLTRATGNRTIEASRSNQVLAAQLAETGGDYVEGIFLQMITNSGMINFTSASGGSVTNYTPTNLPGMTWMAPTPLLTSTISLTDTNFYNLIRQSIPDTNTPSIETNASASDNTANPSLNGRVVTLDHWNAPMLLPNGFASTNQLPNWIYVNRDGSMTSAPSTNVIGRFAYNAYDIGGLLDANVAGYPSSVTAGDTNIAILKGTLAGADLTQIPGVNASDAQTFVGWRNLNSAGSVASYVTDVTNAATNGFLSPTQGDQSFTSRQDLIRYVLVQSNSLTNALPFLTHFTRELARPSLYTNGLNLMMRRFDISQVTHPAGNTNFGLTQIDTHSYAYDSTLALSNSSTNPTFFQVLYSAINLTNSIESNGPIAPLIATNVWPTFMDLKAVAIGANIIDQFDTNHLPRLFSYNANTVSGKKTLPYIMQIFFVYNIDTSKTPTNTINFSIIPQLWSATNPLSTPYLTASIISGNISALNFGAPATLSPGTPSGSISGMSSGVAPVFNNFSTTPSGDAVSSGFFRTSLQSTNPIPPLLSISINGLSFSLSSSGADTNIYSALGAVNSTNPLVAATISPIVTNIAIDPSITTGNLAGISLITKDPRTLREAGSTTNVAGIAALTTSLPRSMSYPYPNAITDTNYTAPSDRINSVGELGYVFREIPWRTIDFVSGSPSANPSSPSSDYALLDVFSAYPTPPSGVRAGVINLNTRQSCVLASMLSGSPLDEAISGSITSQQATEIAQQMVSMTSTNAWTNRSQLVDLAFTNTTLGTEKQNKESIVRALGEVGQTRTWNILIDVVAQTGRFSSGEGSSPTGSQFIVGGENRIWVSTAIDRFTGRVIDRKVEQVK